MDIRTDQPIDDRISRLIERGLDFFGLNRIAEAITVWEEVLRMDPDNHQARDYLNTVKQSGAAEHDDFQNKIVAFPTEKPDLTKSQAVGSEPQHKTLQPPQPISEDTQPINTFEELFRAGMKAYVQRNYSEAITCFEHCQKLRPHDTRVQHNLNRLKKRDGAE